ncbi:neuronal acetylcholine receptor subunit alpha-7-like [Montipora capricornis]|uniref:neuronal acetylcholine receptor subunit alpha-7-like n=1 Tax=Montipora capricornis TaxID=246305 RepID=UPI0035F20F5D
MCKATEKLLLYLLFYVNSIAARKQYYEDLKGLQTDLFCNYSTNIIPQKVKTIAVKVKFDIALNQIIDLDERLQTMTTIVWVRLYWNDFRLKWNSSHYGGIKSFVTSSKKLWLPDITLYNNANDNYDKEKEEYYGLTVSSNGDVGWFYPTIFKSSCTIDVTYFPFDDQKCVLKFGSWSYHGLSMDIFHSGPGDTATFIDNGEWVLVGMPVTKFITKYRCCPEPYPFITYNIVIRRRTMYYILNFLTPCVLMSALTILGFFLPVESGERMNVGVTVLLSLTVILLLLAEELPATSEVVPLISRYYTLTMINVFISIVFTCVVLTFHHHAPTPLPAWVRMFICQWCASVLRVKRNGDTSDSSCAWAKRFFRNHNIRRHSLGERLYGGGSAEPVATNPFLPATNHNSSTCPPNSESAMSIQLKKFDERNPNLRKRVIQGLKQSEALDILVKRTKKDDEKERHQEEWRFAAKVLNRLFMWIVLLLVVFNCLSVLFSAPTENLN